MAISTRRYTANRRLGELCRQLQQRAAGATALQPAGPEAVPPTDAQLRAIRKRAEAGWSAYRTARRRQDSDEAGFERTSWVDGRRYRPEQAAPTSRRQDFDADGFICECGFAPAQQCSQMIGRIGELADGWSPEAALVSFNTRAGEQEKAQGSSDYFLDSSDQVHFFAETGAIDDSGSGSLVAGMSKRRALNKIGHGLHIREPVFRAYARSSAVGGLLHSLGWRRPVLPQSMYIFKQPHIGGESTSHQDSAFLFTTPRQTCVGLWLALHDATIGE